jgi:hypothetical protein
MKYKPFSGVKVLDATCCKPDCTARATWELQYGLTVDDFNHACDEHVAFTLGDSPMLSAVPLVVEPRKPDYLDIVFDGPPGPVTGRFVELEASYGTFKPQSIGAPAEWVEDGDYWRLRIPVFGVYG